VSRCWIGITTYRRERAGRERFTLPAAYIDAVRAVGGIPVLLAPADAEARDVLSRLDGLVLSGGGDLDPASMQVAPHAEIYGTCQERDAFELALARAAVAERLPTLAICRGLQVLNVSLGGSLHLHLPDAVGEAVAHRSSQLSPASHPVAIEPVSLLADSLGAAQLPSVHSWHHQAIDRLAPGVRPVAWAPDGVIEAVEVEGALSVLAVQWHPEMDIEPGRPGRRLFERLVLAPRA
jgi:putative glutamine amidotransferase